jgi:hypothetical protein
MYADDREHFRAKILELIRDFPEAAERLHYLRNYVAESSAVRPDGSLAVYADAMFTVVEVEGLGRRFRLRG